MFFNKSNNQIIKILRPIIIISLMLLITLIVYYTGGVKFVYAHLMYLPIIIAGLSYGFKIGLISGIVGGLLIGPFMPLDVQAGLSQVFSNWFFRLIVFTIVGLLTGYAKQIYKKQRYEISKTLYYHNISNVPNPNIFKITNFNNFEGEVIVTTILIHNYQKIINTFHQTFYYQLLEQIYLNLDQYITDFKVITSNNSNKMWLIINNANLEEVNKRLDRILQKDYKVDNIPIYFDYSFGYKKVDLSTIEEINAQIFNDTDLCATEALIQEKKYLTLESRIIDRDYDYHILTEFKKALKNNEIYLLLQPKVSLKTKQINLEALIRWNHPEKGIIVPPAFIPLVEETKLINDLSIWVLKNVIKEINYFNEKGFYPQISINISTKNLFNDEFIKQALEIIKKSNVDPSKIEFEITENSIMNYQEKANQVLKKLRKFGIKISIDDFGKAYSSLNYLPLLEFDYIKIDRSFIDKISKDNVYEKIVKYIINLSHAIGCKVVSEGVETKEQFDLLNNLGTDYIQGYYILKPSKREDILTWAKTFK